MFPYTGIAEVIGEDMLRMANVMALHAVFYIFDTHENYKN